MNKVILSGRLTKDPMDIQGILFMDFSNIEEVLKEGYRTANTIVMGKSGVGKVFLIKNEKFKKK